MYKRNLENKFLVIRYLFFFCIMAIDYLMVCNMMFKVAFQCNHFFHRLIATLKNRVTISYKRCLKLQQQTDRMIDLVMGERFLKYRNFLEKKFGFSFQTKLYSCFCACMLLQCMFGLLFMIVWGGKITAFAIHTSIFRNF